MEKKTKIFLGVVALATVAYLTRDKWMTKKEKQVYDNGDNIYLDSDRIKLIFNLK